MKIKVSEFKSLVKEAVKNVLMEQDATEGAAKQMCESPCNKCQTNECLQREMKELQETIDKMVSEAFGETEPFGNDGGFGDGGQKPDPIAEGKLPPGLAKFMAKKKGKKVVKEEKPSVESKKKKSPIVKKTKTK